MNNHIGMALVYGNGCLRAVNDDYVPTSCCFLATHVECNAGKWN
jgi:hypothetical protein